MEMPQMDNFDFCKSAARLFRHGDAQRAGDGKTASEVAIASDPENIAFLE